MMWSCCWFPSSCGQAERAALGRPIARELDSLRCGCSPERADPDVDEQGKDGHDYRRPEVTLKPVGLRCDYGLPERLHVGQRRNRGGGKDADRRCTDPREERRHGERKL